MNCIRTDFAARKPRRSIASGTEPGYSSDSSSRTNRRTKSNGLFCPCPTVIPERARVLTPHTPQATCKGSGHKGMTVGQGQNEKQKKYVLGPS